VEVLFGVEFLPAISTIRILSILIVLKPLSGGVFCQLLLTAGKEKSYLACVLIGTVVNSRLQLTFAARTSCVRFDFER
jgi:O-antigen/teichoic acid export membrane protein